MRRRGRPSPAAEGAGCSIRRMRAAVFFDRDGVLLENRDDYVKSWEDVAFLPRAVEAVAGLAPTEYLVVLVTNQSAIGRGIASSATVDAINHRIAQEVRAAGGRVDAIYVCPHTPVDDCSCRKPRPGMLLRAMAELEIDAETSLLIGDATSDLLAARAAGVRGVLVATGRGATEQARLAEHGLGGAPVYPDVAAAVAAETTPLAARA